MKPAITIEKLKKIKKRSLVIMVLGIAVTLFGYSSYVEADKSLGRFNEMVLE